MTGHSFDPGVPFYLAIDLETTGLDPSADPIIEVAWTVLDYQLNEVTPLRSMVAQHTPQSRHRIACNEFVRRMHIENGLLADMAHGEHLAVIERAATADIRRAWRDTVGEVGALQVLGSSVQGDLNFLRAQMPMLQGLLHYRIFDVTTTLNFFGGAGEWKDRPDVIAHRAADDIAWSIGVARELRQELVDLFDLRRRWSEQASRPEAIETIEQLAELPENTVVRDALGQYFSTFEWPGSDSVMTLEMGSEMPGDARNHRFPMRVIERPEETS